MTQLTFYKMQSLGNDFVLINALQDPWVLEKEKIRMLADRKQGVGFDQLLILRPAYRGDFYCQIFNADGSEAEQCGNGLRCVARFLQEEKISSKQMLTLETKAGLFPVEMKGGDQVRVNMGLPQRQPNLLTMKLGASSADLSLLSLGNPHAIHRVLSCEATPVNDWGALIARHPAFPHGVNTGFMEVVDRKTIRLRTYERGVGETLACGSNACAAVVAGISAGWLDSSVSVLLSRGSLNVEWGGESQAVFLMGPAVHVFTGMLLV